MREYMIMILIMTLEILTIKPPTWHVLFLVVNNTHIPEDAELVAQNAKRVFKDVSPFSFLFWKKKMR